MKKNLADLQKQIETAEAGSKAFYTLQKQISQQQAEIDKYEPNKNTASLAKKAENKLAELKKEVADFQAKAKGGTKGEDSELVNIDRTYAKLLEKAKGHETEITKIKEAYSIMRSNRLLELEKLANKQHREEQLIELDEEYEQKDQQLKDQYAERLKLIDDSNRTEQQKMVETAELDEKLTQDQFTLNQEKMTARLMWVNFDLSQNDIELEEKKRLAKEKINLEKQITDNAIAQEKKRASTIKQVNAERKTAEKTLQATIVEAYATGFSLIEGLMKKNTIAYKAFFLLEKIASAAKVIVHLQEELSAIRLATAIQEASVAWIPGAPAVVEAAGQAKLLNAKIGAGIALATIGAQAISGYETGGYSAINYTMPQGYVSRPTLFAGSAARPFIAGEGNKTEYIISSEQLRDPVIANFVGAMEANRGVRRFEAGGYSNAVKKDSVSTSTPVPVYKNDNGDVVNAINKLGQSLKDQKVILSRRLEESENSKVVEIRDSINA